MNSRKLKIVIIGGGIGGLTTAISLQQKGFKSTIFERAPELKPVGAGIVLSSNAMNALDQLGLASKVYHYGIPAKSYTIQTYQGKVLRTVDIQQYSQRYGFPSVGITRAKLHDILTSQLDPNTLKLGISFKSLNDLDDMPDILIGADGLRSNVRNAIWGSNNLTYRFQTGWRGLGTIPKNSDLSHAFEAWGTGKRFGAIQVSDKDVYWYAVKNAPENYFKNRKKSIKAIIKEQFMGWTDPILELIEGTNSEKIISDNICVSPPMKPWYKQNCVLLGDAIHSTTPDLGQGAGMAIESALTFAHCLSHSESIEDAFKRYQDIRYPRTRWVTKKSDFFGRLAGLKNPFFISLRNMGFRLGHQWISKWIEEKKFSRLIGYKIIFND